MPSNGKTNSKLKSAVKKNPITSVRGASLLKSHISVFAVTRTKPDIVFDAAITMAGMNESASGITHIRENLPSNTTLLKEFQAYGLHSGIGDMPHQLRRILPTLSVSSADSSVFRLSELFRYPDIFSRVDPLVSGLCVGFSLLHRRFRVSPSGVLSTESSSCSTSLLRVLSAQSLI